MSGREIACKLLANQSFCDSLWTWEEGVLAVGLVTCEPLSGAPFPF